MHCEGGELGTAATKAQRQVNDAAREAAPWVERLARAGFFSRGVVYVVVALLAARAAFEQRHPAGTRGAMLEILHHPMGRVLLPLLALGLLGFALWSAVQAVLDPERRGTSLKGLGKRTAHFFTAIIYVGLAATAARLAVYGWAQGDRDSAGAFTRPVMEHPLGRWIVAGVGVVMLGFGAWLLYRSVAKDPEKMLDVSSLRPNVQKAFDLAGRVGVAARGVVFGVIGVYLGLAALHHRPNEARMPAGALESVRQQPHGRWLLAVVAIGLAAFGLFEMVKARYRVIRAAK
jgi:hypothetical protein